MKELRVDLSTYQRDSDFYGELDLRVTVKNFDLQAIRARYLASKQNKNHRAGSVERREPALGGVLSMLISKGQIQEQEVIEKLKEPRGIAQHGDILAYSSENKIFIHQNGQRRELYDPWFSYIHTVDFNSDGSRLLVSSSGFDVILEYNLETLGRTDEWWAWENGFDRGIDPQSGEAITLSRVPLDGKDVKVIQDPLTDSLPTAMRAAFINSVEYGNDDNVFIATFFHEGKAYRIDRSTGKAEAIISGMKNPHGGMQFSAGYMATSTRTGEVIMQDESLRTVFDYRSLAHKPKELEGEEWLQNSKMLPDGSILTIDSNRTHWVIFHPEKELLDMIPYDDNLAIQDLVVI